MPELDYAFLADYAKVEPSGTLTVVGGGFTHMAVDDFPVAARIFVVARIRSALGTPPVQINVTFGPDGREGPTINAAGLLEVLEDAVPYREDRVGHVLAMELVAPMLDAGRFRVSLEIEGEVARELYFAAGQPGA